MKDAGDAISVKAVITEKQPALLPDDLKTISDVLGTCTTDFPAAEQPAPPTLQLAREKSMDVFLCREK